MTCRRSRVAARTSSPPFVDCTTAAKRVRGQLLEMVRLRLRQWCGAAAGPESWPGVFTSTIEPLWVLAGAAPPRWAESDAPLKRRQSIASDLIAAVDRFNRRWLEALDRVNLEPTNFVIEQYNRYYVLEKECVMGSARLAARHFTPLPPVTKPRCCSRTIQRFPFPQLADRRWRPVQSPRLDESAAITRNPRKRVHDGSSRIDSKTVSPVALAVFFGAVTVCSGSRERLRGRARRRTRRPGPPPLAASSSRSPSRLTLSAVHPPRDVFISS